MKSDIIDVSCHLHHQTDAAIFVSDDDESANAVWLPKSQVEFTHDDDANYVTVTLPEWLAIEKELI